MPGICQGFAMFTAQSISYTVETQAERAFHALSVGNRP